MLPVEPGMAELVGQNVASSGDRQPFPEVNDFQLVVPNAIGIRVATIHLGIRELADGDPIAEGQNDP